MIRVYFSPIGDLKEEVSYSFSVESVTITVDGISDTFDFTGIPDGELDYSSIETSLPMNPILTVERVDGILYIECLNGIGKEATEFDKFPNWIEVGVDDGTI